MTQNNKLSDQKISIEDLLKFKRDERPPVEFWDSFELELHRKTLRALVVSEPWYGKFLRPSFARMAIIAPIAAVAATAVGLIYYSNSEPSKIEIPKDIAVNTSTPVSPALIEEIPLAKYSESQNRSRRQFVNYVIMLQNDNGEKFITVMTPETFKADTQKAVYVADPLTGVESTPVLISAPKVEKY